MGKRTYILSLLLVFGFFSHFCLCQLNVHNNDPDYYRKLIAELQRDINRCIEMRDSLTNEQNEVCQVYLNLKAAQLIDADEKEIIRLYKQLQQLISKEPDDIPVLKKRLYALNKVFVLGEPVPFACIGIAGICRDSEEMPLDEKIAEISNQGDISNDARIRQMVVDLYTQNSRYEEAIDYCQKQIAAIQEGKTQGNIADYQLKLIETRMLYQIFLFAEAMKIQGIDIDEVINIGPHLVKIELEQYKIAKKEVETLINDNPQYAVRCVPFFSGRLVGDLEEVREFTEYLKQIIQLNREENLYSRN